MDLTGCVRAGVALLEALQARTARDLCPGAAAALRAWLACPCAAHADAARGLQPGYWDTRDAADAARNLANELIELLEPERRGWRAHLGFLIEDLVEGAGGFTRAETWTALRSRLVAWALDEAPSGRG